MLKNVFIDLLRPYQLDQVTTENLWLEIESKHSDSSRHYHSLKHLSDLYDQLISVKSEIKRWDMVLFTLFYHDIIYNSTKSNNEEKSAELARKRMLEIGLPESDAAHCFNQILATKSHNISENHDTNIFTDADLSILGRDWEVYDQYCQNVRKEYSIFPNIIYRRGRKKVLKHFLSMERIFKTEPFYEKYEEAARKNMRKELRLAKGSKR